MTYSDLIQFDPIESVVELRSADEHDRAEGLVRNYVISDAMADRLADVVFPQLQFERPVDNKGLMVVGNYGTGKSHLMAVISAVAEHADVTDALRNDRVAEAAQEVAGRFKVVRTELGSTKMDFREFIVRQLEAALASWGVDYQFPAYDQVGNHKPAFEAMMAAFNGAFPDHGLLLVVDELLDYFRTRKGQQLTLDLNFLREIGEVCRESRFRFVAGLQEMLFDNPSFEFAAAAVQRVKDRFEQVLIAKRDVKFVVAERLLQKSPEQQARVRDYLLPFAPFYGRMNERMDEYVRLFPVHPDYVDAFEQIHFVEQRQVLKTLSQEMKSVMADQVPTDRPGLIAYDSYWTHIEQNPALKSHPDVGEVIEVHGILQSRVEQAFTRPAYTPMALRVIDGLSVHRLTTRDVRAPIGATAEELRDSLCLYDPVVADLGGDPADDLLSQVEAVLGEVVKTVSGQFISYNRDNRQYYVDLQKTEDFDAIIERRIEAISPEELDRAYYDALKRVLEKSDRPAHQNLAGIWEHEVLWLDRKAGREGYLFFGTPNERNTAIPPLEFYLYFLQPYDAAIYADEERADEVFFHLAKRDDTFEAALRRYAAATALASSASADARSIYRRKADESIRDLTKWLSENITTAFEVTHQGRTKTVPQWLKGVNIREALGFGPQHAATPGSILDHVNLVAATALADHFEAEAPEYPRFSVPVTTQSRAQAAADALRVVRGARPTKQATAVLDALELLDGDRLAPHDSRYARFVLDRMEAKGHGQVVNRSELVENAHGVEFVAPQTFRLEPDWLAVVLAALVHHGDAVLAVPGRKFTATDLDALAATPVADLAAFKHVERPKDWNVAGLRGLLELVGMAPGQVTALTQGDEAPVRELQGRLGALTDRLVDALQRLHQGLHLWGKSLLTDQEARDHQERLAAAKTFLEGAQRYDTPGKLKNFNEDAQHIAEHAAAVRALGDVERLAKLALSLGHLTSYLSQAETVLPDGHPWVETMRALRSEILATLEDPEARQDTGLESRLAAQLERAKADYGKAYRELLRKARLGLEDDQRKAAILSGARVQALDALRTVDILPAGQLDQTKDALAKLEAASVPGPDALRHQPTFEGFQPARGGTDAPAVARLDALDTQIDRMVDGWTTTLLEALDRPGTQEKLDLLAPDARQLVDAFCENRALPESVTPPFVTALREVLSDLRGVPVPKATLTERLFQGGAPATPTQLRQRLDAYLGELADGADPDKVRLLLED